MTDQKLELPNDQNSSGRTLGLEEIEAVSQAIRSGTLTATKGTFARTLGSDFAAQLGLDYGYPCASGTCAVHAAVVAIDPAPGDEIITTSITDMGALAPIVYQGAIPMFCDVDARTGNVTAEAIEAVISERTRAIIVTHLFGNPCEMDAICALAKARGIPLIEDCAQAYGTTWKGRPVGTFGDIACFSLQQGKHITSGEGGIVLTSNEEYGRRVRLFIDKAWGYGDPKPDHYFLALNGRMSELQGAVALAQLGKLEENVKTRITMADALSERVQGLSGIASPHVPDGAVHTYWKYCLRVDGRIIDGGPVAMAGPLRARGIFCAPRYIQKPAFRCAVFADQVTFGGSRWPFTEARPEAVDYSQERFPGTFAMLEDVLVLPINERYCIEHIEAVAAAIREVHAGLTGGAS